MASPSTEIVLDTKNIPSRGQLLYFAADTSYFESYGRALLGSLLKLNPQWHGHVHLYNPSDEIVEYLSRLERVTFSYERTNSAYFVEAARKLRSSDDKALLIRVTKAIKAHDRSRLCGVLSHLLKCSHVFAALMPEAALVRYLEKTYFSCQRFVVLGWLGKTAAAADIFAVDADALANRPFPARLPHQACDLAIQARRSDRQQFLAGAIYLPCDGRRDEFLQAFADKLEAGFKDQALEWGLDQIVLHTLVPAYRWQHLDSSLCDLNFRDDSVIWLAKGVTKASVHLLGNGSSH